MAGPSTPGREVRLRLLVWVALIALLALTVALSFAPLGPFRLAVSLAIAAAKAGLIAWVYMGLAKVDGVTRLAAGVALLLLAILFVLTGVDFAVRA